MKRRMLIATTLLVLMSAAPVRAEAGLTSYRVKIVLYPGDDGAAVARRLAAMYRGTLESAIDAEGEFVIALPGSGASLMRKDPTVERFETSALQSTPQTEAVTAAWKLGDYEYDGSGNIRKIGADFFAYDTKNRLVVSADASGTPVTHRQTYAYDNFGNLTAITTAGAPQTALAASSSSNRVTAVTTGPQVISPQYDGAGNMTGYGTATYTYDALNVMTKSAMGGVSRYYVYTPSDERIATVEVSSAGTRAEWTIRDTGGQVLRRFSKETTGEWKWQEDYVYRGSQMLAAEVPDPARTRHFHLDHLGTPRLITGNGGAEISRHNYHPFGVEIAPTSSPTREKKQFTGHERDAESLDYMHARFYAPYMGRFLSVDPLRASMRPASPQTWNRYTYARSNPMNRVDRSGLIDVRCEEDQRITESDPVLVVSSQLDRSVSRGVEYGAIIGAGGSVYGPFTSNNPGFVDPKLGLDLSGQPRVKGTNEIPVRTMHTHLDAGTYPVPNSTQTFTATDPSSPSADDAEMATLTVPGYILVPSQKLLVKINSNGTSDVVLSGRDYEQWQARASQARQERVSDRVRR